MWEVRQETLVVQLLFLSFCCLAAAIKMQLDPVFVGRQVFPVGLAVLGVWGFARYARQLSGTRQGRQLRIIIATIAATAISTAAATAATIIAVATAATMYIRAALNYSVRRLSEGRRQRRRWEVLGLGVEVLELGALLLQMILMTHWVFGEFSVVPVMTTMGMMFALLHNVHSYAEEFGLADAQDPVVWWEEAF